MLPRGAGEGLGVGEPGKDPAEGPAVIEGDGGDHQRTGETPPPGLIGAGDHAPRAIEAGQAPPVETERIS